MAFSVKGEYERLIKIKNTLESKGKQMPFEWGCVCGFVTRIEYCKVKPYDFDRTPPSIWLEEEIQVYVNCFGKEDLALTLREKDVKKRYQDRKYRWNKKYKILESFVR